MLSELFKTEERLKILNYVIYKDAFTTAQVAKETGVTKGLVSRYLRFLVAHQLLIKSGNEYHPLVNTWMKAIKVLLNLDKIKTDSLDLSWAKGIGVFGSSAEGTNTSESDFDIWVLVETYPSEYDLAKLQKDLRLMTGAEVNMIVLTLKKIEDLKGADPPFYNSLVRTSMVLKGESLE
jgi:predicted nucleotidyltransferase